MSNRFSNFSVAVVSVVTTCLLITLVPKVLNTLNVVREQANNPMTNMSSDLELKSSALPVEIPDCTRDKTRLKEIKLRLSELSDYVQEVNSKVISENDLDVINQWTNQLKKNNREQENLLAEQLYLTEKMMRKGCSQGDLYGF